MAPGWVGKIVGGQNCQNPLWCPLGLHNDWCIGNSHTIGRNLLQSNIGLLECVDVLEMRHNHITANDLSHIHI